MRRRKARRRRNGTASGAGGGATADARSRVADEQHVVPAACRARGVAHVGRAVPVNALVEEVRVVHVCARLRRTSHGERASAYSRRSTRCSRPRSARRSPCTSVRDAPRGRGHASTGITARKARSRKHAPCPRRCAPLDTWLRVGPPTPPCRHLRGTLRMRGGSGEAE